MIPSIIQKLSSASSTSVSESQSATSSQTSSPNLKPKSNGSKIKRKFISKSNNTTPVAATKPQIGAGLSASKSKRQQTSQATPNRPAEKVARKPSIKSNVKLATKPPSNSPLSYFSNLHSYFEKMKVGNDTESLLTRSRSPQKSVSQCDVKPFEVSASPNGRVEKQPVQAQDNTNYRHELRRQYRFADEPEYDMNHAHRGYALIFNNKHFSLDMPVREGTEQDGRHLEQTLRGMEFETKVFENCTADFLRQTFNHYATKVDHSNSDCFMCVILSHGESDLIYGVDKQVELEQLIHPFKYCATLAGKPKMFFIQACRGSKLMESIDSNPFDTTTYVKRIPVEADFLYGYSTVYGHYSWRNSVQGSWFIQELCRVFDQYGSELEIMQLLTIVNRRVAYYHESNASDKTMSGKRQVPCIVSMLTKELYFKPKAKQSTKKSVAF